MAKRLLLYAGCKYNRRPIITSNEYPCRPSRYKDTGYKYNKGPATSSKYLWRPSSARADYLYLGGR